MITIPERYLDLLADEKKAFLYLATSMQDGSPQVTPVWFSYEDGYLLVNSARGRVKDRNMRRHPHVAACIQDPGNPYRYLQLRGRVVEIREQGAEEHILGLAKKYTGQASFQKSNPDEVRVIYRILPESIDEH